MMRRLFIFLGIGISLIFFQETALGFWIWSPKSSKFTDPRRIAKGSPQEQLNWALSFFEAKDYPRAIREMENLTRRYPRSAEAAEAFFFMGRSHEALEEYEAAFKDYEGVVKKYPNSGRIQEIVEREYRIANLFYSGKKRKIAGLEILPSFEKAAEIFQRVIENAPYGPYAELSQYKIGECYRKSGDYKKAREAFEKLMEDYPKSELVNDAKYQIALATFQMSRGASYDDEATDKAIEQFSKFVKEHPESDVVEESREAIRTLRERKAEKAFEIAEFYVKQGAVSAATVYYDKVIDQYGETSWATRALEKLKVLEKQKKK